MYQRKNFIVKDIDSFKVIKYLNKNNIYARKYYPPLNYIFPFFKKKLVNYENCYKHLINFWVGDETSLKEINRIKNIIKKKYYIN